MYATFMELVIRMGFPDRKENRTKPQNIFIASTFSLFWNFNKLWDALAINPISFKFHEFKTITICNVKNEKEASCKILHNQIESSIVNSIEVVLNQQKIVT